MTDLDDANEDVRSGRGRRESGDNAQTINARDPQFRGLVSWAWVAIGGIAVAVGWGVYDKLSSINETLIVAVADIRNQGTQVAELKTEVRDLRNAQNSLQRQVDSLDGKTMRGIEELKRGQ